MSEPERRVELGTTCSTAARYAARVALIEVRTTAGRAVWRVRLELVRDDRVCAKVDLNTDLCVELARLLERVPAELAAALSKVRP